jgi:uncharacterized protein
VTSPDGAGRTQPGAEQSGVARWLHRYPVVPETAAAAAVLSYGYLIVRVIPAPWYVPANLAAAGLAVFLVHRGGSGWADLGLRREDAGRGLRWGLATVVPIAAVVAVGVALTFTRKYFVEDKFLHESTARTLYELFVRIPFGTALAEELIFRAALLALYLRRHSFWKAAALSSLVFGFWHVLPAMGSVSSNAAGETLATPAARAAGVLATVFATAAAGMVFCWLRGRSRSVVAPWITHASLNSLGVVAGLVVAHWLGG